jgi:hypothetical protein
MSRSESRSQRRLRRRGAVVLSAPDARIDAERVQRAPDGLHGLGEGRIIALFPIPRADGDTKEFMESASVQANAATWNAGSGGALKLYIRSTASGAARVSVQRQAFDENLNMQRKLAGSKPASEAG